jgi:phosphate:Na+ symporter
MSVFRPFSDTPQAPGKLARTSFLALGLVLAALLASSPLWGKSNAEQADSEEEALGNSQRLVTKLIPDQQVYLGSPDTILDLSEVFAETPIATGEPITFEIAHNKTKGKVAEATIDGSQLRLSWKKLGTSEIVLRATNSATGAFLDNKFNVEVWQADYWKLFMAVMGGLGIFLLGMKNMSEGLQAVAGGSLRRMISIATNNRLLATGVGVLVTMLVQSSSITTVMTIGFVNSGFMTLSQAIGVIMGANIGTTITGWILVLNIGKYGLLLVGLGAFGYLFLKGDRPRYLAMAAMGLGMIFFGLELMKDGFSVVKDLPEFEAWFHRFSADTYWGVLKCAAVGCVLTFVVQSSSATLGITIGLAVMDVIPFDTAAALVLGENIGTTITAWLASFGATTNAKRAAYFHVVFNVIGVAWITLIFIPVYLPLVKSIVGVDPTTGKVENVTSAIAFTHTGFNVVNTLVFLPFSGMFAGLLKRLIPDKAHKEKPHLTSLDIRGLDTPVIAIEQSRVEVLRMAHSCDKMMSWLRACLEEDEPDHKRVQKLFHREEVLDTIQDEIVAFITDLMAGNLPHNVIDEGRRQLRMADEYESVSDYITSILKFYLKLRKQGHQFDDRRRQELLDLHDMAAEYLGLVTGGYENRTPEIITKANTHGQEITKRVKELRDRHLEQLPQESVDPNVNIAFTATLNSYRRVRDHAKNIAEALAGIK